MSEPTWVVHTMLSQGHLMMAQAPTYWNYDHALGFYPLPDLLLLGLYKGEALEYSKLNCHVVAPGAGWAKVTLGKQQTLQVEYSQDEEEEDE
jgi:hypothetical protein